MTNVKLKSNMPKWIERTSARIDIAVLDMATDIHRVAVTLAPRETGALVTSGRIVKQGIAHYAIVFGGGRVPYAKRRHYENKKTPGSLRYLERAGDSVKVNIQRYLGKIK